MGKYLIKRIIHGIISVLIVVFLVMLLVYTLMDRQLIFKADPNYSHLSGTNRTVYMYRQWEAYGYLDYVPYTDYLDELVAEGSLDAETRASAARLGNTAEDDSAITAEYVAKYTEYYEDHGYTITRLDAVRQGSTRTASQLFAYRDINVFVRLWNYITSLIQIDNIHYAEGIADEERGITFT